MSGLPLILASASPRRRALLAALGRPFTVKVADVDETARPGEPPIAYALRLAREKAAAVAEAGAAGADQASPALVLGADTIVVLDGAILGKPASADEARAFLRRLRGRRHLVVTAVAVLPQGLGHRAEAEGQASWAATGVWMRDYADAEIEAYVASGDALDKAGGYAIQHPSFQPVAALQGSETNVIGLPLGLTAWLLDRLETGAAALA